MQRPFIRREKCGNDVKNGAQFCPKCGEKMRVNTGSTKKAEKKGVSFTWKRPQISIKAARLLGAVLVLVFAVLLLKPSAGKIDTQAMMEEYFAEHSEYSENENLYHSCFDYMVNDLTEQFFQNIKLSLGKLGENFEDKEVSDISSKLGKVLSESFSRAANMEQLAESVTSRSYFEAEKAKKKDGIVSAAVTVHYLDIPDINRRVIEDYTGLSELVNLVINRKNLWMNLTDMAFGDASLILNGFEEKAESSTADKTYTGTVEFTYNKEEKRWEISSVDSGLLDAWFGIQ